MPEEMCFSMYLSLKMGFCEEQKSLKSEKNLNSHIPEFLTSE